MEIVFQNLESHHGLRYKNWWSDEILEGRFRQNSDIDIAVLGLKKYDYYKFIGEISDLLNRRVDVVLLEECAFAHFIKKKLL